MLGEKGEKGAKGEKALILGKIWKWTGREMLQLRLQRHSSVIEVLVKAQPPKAHQHVLGQHPGVFNETHCCLSCCYVVAVYGASCRRKPVIFMGCNLLQIGLQSAKHSEQRSRRGSWC